MNLRLPLRRAFAPEAGWLPGLGASVLAIAGALAVSGATLAMAGFRPLEVFGVMANGALGSPQAIGVTVTNAIPLILAGLGVALPFRCGLLNIGGEGQIYMGALGATLVTLAFPGLPAAVHLPLALLGGFVGGGLWGAFPGWLRASKGLNEIITTIMLNYIGFWIVSFLVHGPLKDPDSYGYAWTVKVPESARLPMILPEARIHLGIVVALILAAFAHFLLWHTTLGFEMRAVGAGPETSRFSGIAVRRSVVLSLLIGGGMAGMAGAAIILGVQFRLSDFFSPGYGFDAIAVALVGQTTPFGVVAAGLFFGALSNGVGSAHRDLGVAQGTTSFIQGVTMMFIVASQSLTLIRLLRKRRMARLAENAH